ncbi:hypothetical protein FHY19_003088 [Xanthomonas arboricola]|nr:hypothetical protein [Xanthomonas sp. 4461]
MLAGSRDALASWSSWHLQRVPRWWVGKALQQVTDQAPHNCTIYASQSFQDAEISRLAGAGYLQAWWAECAVPSPLAGHAVTRPWELDGGTHAANGPAIGEDTAPDRLPVTLFNAPSLLGLEWEALGHAATRTMSVMARSQTRTPSISTVVARAHHRGRCYRDVRAGCSAMACWPASWRQIGNRLLSAKRPAPPIGCSVLAYPSSVGRALVNCVSSTCCKALP